MIIFHIDFQAVKASVTLLFGKESQFIRAEDKSELQAAIPLARNVELPGGHNLHLDSPRALAEAIAAESTQAWEAFITAQTSGS